MTELRGLFSSLWKITDLCGEQVNTLRCSIPISVIMFCVRFDKEAIVTCLRLHLYFKLTKCSE